VSPGGEGVPVDAAARRAKSRARVAGLFMKIVGGKWSNWSGNVKFRPREVIAPRDEVELAAAVRKADNPVRFPGSGHSFSPLNQTNGTLIDLSAFIGLQGCDPERQTVSIAAATPLWGLGSLLHPVGYALKNMSDVDRQTLAGAIATSTHGTGRALGSLSADVASFRLLLANGQVIHCSSEENADIFCAGRTAMGMLGVMTEIDMQVRPVYKLQRKYFLHPTDELFRQLDGLTSTNRHFEFYWFPYSDVAVCKALNESDAHVPTRHSARTLHARGERRRANEYVFAGLNEATRYMPGLTKASNRFCSRFMSRMEKVRWSHEVYPTARTVRFNEMEYAVAYEKGADTVREIVEVIRKRRITTGFPIEFRTVAADDVWLSPFYHRESATIGIHQYAKVDANPLFEACEAIFRNNGGRPHWGKIHTRTRAEIAELYPKFEDFCAVRAKLDPTGKFLNDHLGALFG
jgi:FAD-linked oxidoreductase